MENPRIIGHVVSVQGFRLKVELLPETKSALRATFDGVQVAVGINVYLSFAIGPGSVVIGMITDLEARESYDPTSGEELRLELLKPRRIANVQLICFDLCQPSSERGASDVIFGWFSAREQKGRYGDG